VPRILGGTIFPQILVFFFLGGRIISRVLVVGKWAWDDTLIVIAWIFSLVLTVLLDYSTLYGHGHHIQDVPPQIVFDSFKISFFTLIAYQLALTFTKYSILVFYLRVFPAKREQWLTWGTIIFVAVFSTPLLAGDIFQCNPITGEPFLTARVMCFQARPVLIASSVLHTVTDAWMILMVIPVVSTLNIPRKQKWALMGVLSLGIFVIMASIARITALLGIGNDVIDITWVIAIFDIWSVLETCIGIICACAPTIRPLLHKVFPNFLASRSGSGTVKTTQNTARRASTIELGSRNLRNKISSPIPIVAERKDSWVPDNISELKLIVKQGVAVRNPEYKFFPISPLKRNPSTGRGSRASMVRRGEGDSLDGEPGNMFGRAI
jgi:hypothetical protein